MLYVYRHINKNNGQTFYIGYGNLHRANQTARMKNSPYTDYKHQYRLTRKDIITEVLFCTECVATAKQIEDQYITQYKDTLVNKGTNRELTYKRVSLGGIASNKVHKKNKTGFFSDKEDLKKIRQENGRKMGLYSYEKKIGLFAMSKERLQEIGSKTGVINGRINGKKVKDQKKGIFGRTKEQHFNDSSKGGKIIGVIVGNRPEVKERLRKMSKYAAMKRARRVICVNDQKVFESISEASKYYNIDASGIVKVCKLKNKQIKQKIFKYEAS